MKTLNNFIIEKLKITKNIKLYNDDHIAYLIFNNETKKCELYYHEDDVIDAIEKNKDIYKTTFEPIKIQYHKGKLYYIRNLMDIINTLKTTKEDITKCQPLIEKISEYYKSKKIETICYETFK